MDKTTKEEPDKIIQFFYFSVSNFAEIFARLKYSTKGLTTPCTPLRHEPLHDNFAQASRWGGLTIYKFCQQQEQL